MCEKANKYSLTSAEEYVKCQEKFSMIRTSLSLSFLSQTHTHTDLHACWRRSMLPVALSPMSQPPSVSGRTDGRISPLSISSHYQPSTLERLWGLRYCKVAKLCNTQQPRAHGETEHWNKGVAPNCLYLCPDTCNLLPMFLSGLRRDKSKNL